MPKHRKFLPNGRQQEPQGGGAKRSPLGAAPKAPPCCLPFGKDFLCFGLISGAHPEAFPPSFFWDCPPSLVFPQVAFPQLKQGHGAKRLNSERGVRGAAAPRWLKILPGTPPRVVISSGTLRTSKVVPHLGWSFRVAP